MYKTKMVKVYLPRVQVCIFSLMVNLLVLGIQPLSTVAQDLESQPNNRQAANNASTTMEPEILSEINRVRTNPQGYAQWLEEQRQYYDGIWLKLPGEKPIRTNKGLKALEEAIAILKEQQPLSPLSESEQAAATAIEKLNNFATANNIQYISYGRTTPKGIVMSLVVDELFPDRRRRNSLLSPDANNTGVVCKPDPRYAKVCAIAYANSAAEIAQAKPETPPAPDPTPAVENATEQSPPPQDREIAEPQPSSTVTEPAAEEPEIATETLPQPPQAPSTPPIPEVVQPTPEVEEEMDVAQADAEEEVNSDEAIEPEAENQELEAAEEEVVTSEIEPETENQELEAVEEEVVTSEIEPETENQELEAVEAEVEVQDAEDEELNTESAASADDSGNEDVEVFQAEENTEEVAINSDSSRILENVERGTLEDGDLIIAEDGSLYDSYPLEGKSGESFTIDLESDEFDAFVALIDAKGNIIEQNDDIDAENSNSRIRVTIPEDGVYNVIVNAYDQGGTGKYVLTVRR